MVYVVLAVWLVQAVVGVLLLLGWARSGRHSAPVVLSHVALALVSLGLWIAFVLTGSLVWAWSAFAVITVGNGVGDAMLVQRFRRTQGARGGFWRDYGGAIRAVFRGDMPRRVIFHALFAGVVYFLTLGVCIGATVAVNA